MRLRGVWVVRAHRNTRADLAESTSVLAARRFPTVERAFSKLRNPGGSPRSSRTSLDHTSDLQIAQAFARALQQPVPISMQDDVPIRWVCSISDDPDLWPVCYVERDDVCFLAIPLTAESHAASPGGDVPLSGELLTISATLAALRDLAEVCAQWHPRYAEGDLLKLSAMLREALPFGRPAVTHPDTLRAVTTATGGGAWSTSDARGFGWRPAWGSGGSGKVEIEIEETVNCALYDNAAGAEDAWEAAGVVRVRVDAEGPSPEVTLHMLSCERLRDLTWSQFCMRQPAQQSGESSTEIVQVVPPPGLFVLARYLVARPAPKAQPPLRGFFQLKEDGPGRCKLLLQLKLDSSVNNSFSKLEVSLPFCNRGTIAAHQSTPSLGSVDVSDDKGTLVWTIGQRITSAKLELALAATVAFDTSAMSPNPDPFCTGTTCYAQLRFTVQNWCPSGLEVDPKRCSLFLSQQGQRSSPALRVDRTCVSGSYLIWNSLGNARRVATAAVQHSLFS